MIYQSKILIHPYTHTEALLGKNKNERALIIVKKKNERALIIVIDYNNSYQ